MKRAFVAFGLALALALAGPAALADDRALLVGIDDYQVLPGAPVVTGAVADVERMHAVLTGPLGFQGHQITRLIDAGATADAILSAVIDRLISETAPGDRVVLYFAGLGTTLSSGTPALLAHDAGSVLGEIPLSTIAEVLAIVADREVLVVIDAGFDGGVPGARGRAGRASEEPVTFAGAEAVWIAASPGQLAWEAAGAGVFTAAWAEAVAGAADADGDGTVTAGEVTAHVAARLADWCDGAGACLAAGRGLAPRFEGDDDLALWSRVPLVPVAAEIPGPILADDGAPASFRETLGFVTDLFAPSNAAGLTLAISGGDSLTVGDFVTFTVSADRPGALVLLDVDPDGALAQVYPSRLSAEGATRLAPGRPLTIPSALGVNGTPLRIRVTEPAGQGLLLGLFIEGDLPDLTGLLPAGLDGGAVANAGQSLFEIAQGLLALEADPDREVAWSATYLPYRIAP